MVIGQEWDYELHDTMVYNTRYEETYWKGLCDQVGPRINVINHAKASRLYLSPPLHNYH